ncbi:FMRFamide receptor [Biomphalaria glabrata]|nr:FMRFamide receptor [Biomphalaria glabrata]
MTISLQAAMPALKEINLKVNVSYGDVSLNDDNSASTNLILFVFWGIFLPLVATVGLIGNTLTIIVLWRKEMHSTTILYLRGLVITDTGILIGSVLALTPISCANYLQGDALLYFKDTVYPVLHTPAYYLVMTLQQCNVWVTVSVSMERYISICHPFRASRLISRRKTIMVIVVIAFVSLIYNIPHLLASEATPCTGTTLPETTTILAEAGGLSSSQFPASQPPVIQTPPTNEPKRRCLIVGTTDFGNTEFYKIYRTIMYTILIYVIPFLALVILNSFLIKELMVMQKRRVGTNIHEENEANLSLVLVLIVIVFIFCQTPGLISQFDIISVDVFFCWLAVSNLLFTLNSAVNFLIYTAFGRKFRHVLLRVFRHVFNKKRRFSTQSSIRTTQVTLNDHESNMDTDTRCSSLSSLKCYKKESKSSDSLQETVPLNQMKGDKRHTTHNGNYLKRKQELAPMPESESEVLELMGSIPLNTDNSDIGLKNDQTFNECESNHVEQEYNSIEDLSALTNGGINNNRTFTKTVNFEPEIESHSDTYEGLLYHSLEVNHDEECEVMRKS